MQSKRNSIGPYLNCICIKSNYLVSLPLKSNSERSLICARSFYINFYWRWFDSVLELAQIMQIEEFRVSWIGFMGKCYSD